MRHARSGSRPHSCDGRILYRDPSEHAKPAVFDAQGRPYIDYLRWEDGEMIVERSKVAT